MSKVFYLLLISVLPSWMAVAHASDLPPWDSINAEAEAYAAKDMVTGETGVYVQIHHQQSNSLSCELSLTVRLEQETGGIASKVVRLRNVLVMPKAAFGFEVALPIEIRLPQGEAIATDYQEVLEARCSGWDTKTPLPDSLCRDEKLNPGHERTCGLLTHGQQLYAWDRNGAYIGTCRCD